MYTSMIRPHLDELAEQALKIEKRERRVDTNVQNHEGM